MLLVFGILASVIVLQLACNYVLVEPYYTWKRSHLIERAYEELQKETGNREKMVEIMNDYEDAYNIQFMLANKRMVCIYNSRQQNFRNGRNYYRVRANFSFRKNFSRFSRKPETVIVSNDGEKNRAKISLFGILESKNQTYYVVIKSNIKSIKENMNETSQLVTVFSGVALALGVILAYIFGKKVSEPIIQMNEVTCHVAKMDFSKTVTETKKQDELVIKNKETITIEQKIFSTKTNKEEWLKIIKSPIFDKDKNVIGIIVVIENISKEKEIESQKETFVATLTHDLKTPTYAQTRAMKLLQEEILGSLNNDQKEMIEQTLNSNLYMTELISTILSTYKSDSGKTVLNKEEFDFCELVNSTCKEISNLAREKRQKIIFQTNIKNKIIADKLQIKRVIINLVSNAISHGFQDSEIKIKLDEDDENISFNVENHSKYLSKETLKEIFEKYKTAPESRFKKTSTGLGLYLSKQIINSHKGKIFADSRKNDETCIFGFSIPKVKKEEAKTLNNNSV